jgi:hypothetical protein
MANGLSFGELEMRYGERFRLGMSEYNGQQYLVRLASGRGGNVDNQEAKALRGR